MGGEKFAGEIVTDHLGADERAAAACRTAEKARRTRGPERTREKVPLA